MNKMAIGLKPYGFSFFLLGFGLLGCGGGVGFLYWGCVGLFFFEKPWVKCLQCISCIPYSLLFLRL